MAIKLIYIYIYKVIGTILYKYSSTASVPVNTRHVPLGSSILQPLPEETLQRRAVVCKFSDALMQLIKRHLVP